MDQCVAVFTARSLQRILREGGSQAWVLDPNRVRATSFLVCVQNQNNPDRDFSDASEPHGRAFIVGSISDVVPALDDEEGRWRICISDYAVCHVADAWKRWRNPVKYTTLEELGIDLASLNFQPFPEVEMRKESSVVESMPILSKHADEAPAPMSFATAKVGVAAFYGVAPEAVEIIIRG